LGYFIQRLSLCINIEKDGLGYILGKWFTNSSGHPAPDVKYNGPTVPIFGQPMREDFGTKKWPKIRQFCVK
jgi:hypothetical protein